VHQPGALWPLQNHGELAALYCWTFFLLVFTGPGAFAVDSLLGRRAAAGRIERTGKTPAASSA
jgi:putative oxidoreductase